MSEQNVLKTQRKAVREYHAGKSPKTSASKAMVRKKQVVAPGQGLKQTDLVAFNHKAEKAAVDYLREYILAADAPSFNTACNLIALQLDVSVETAKRYLRKYSVDHPKAPFSIQDGYVRLRTR
jgi:hypothetical protein